MVAAVLVGCAGAVEVEAAPFATDPACAGVLVLARSVDALGGRPRRDTTSQSTAAWGEPPVVLRCGVEPVGPTTDACLDAAGVDWVRSGGLRYTTYGRQPAVEVRLPEGVQPIEVLGELSALVAPLPQRRQCL
jgi:Protein of unknown function (DUF3515)